MGYLYPSRGIWLTSTLKIKIILHACSIPHFKVLFILNKLYKRTYSLKLIFTPKMGYLYPSRGIWLPSTLKIKIILHACFIPHFKGLLILNKLSKRRYSLTLIFTPKMGVFIPFKGVFGSLVHKKKSKSFYMPLIYLILKVFSY